MDNVKSSTGDITGIQGVLTSFTVKADKNGNDRGVGQVRFAAKGDAKPRSTLITVGSYNKMGPAAIASLRAPEMIGQTVALTGKWESYQPEGKARSTSFNVSSFGRTEKVAAV